MLQIGSMLLNFLSWSFWSQVPINMVGEGL